MKNIIKLWKENNIDEAIFEFSCGGDSMNETELRFINNDCESVENDELHNFFEDEIYKKVNFYEASDGHYMGESGSVIITLSEDEKDFCYDKTSESEWSEVKEDVIPVPLTQEEYNFLSGYVLAMSLSGWDGERIDYKKDLILTDKYENLIKELHKKFNDYSDDFEPETNGEPNYDTKAYNTTNEDTGEMTFNKVNDVVMIDLIVRVECIEYRSE